MYITLAFRTVPDARILGGRQTIPHLRAPERKLAGNARLFSGSSDSSISRPLRREHTHFRKITATAVIFNSITLTDNS